MDFDQIISSYVKANLSPKGPEHEMITSKYGELKDILSERTFQSGSYARHTSTTPVNDLDVFYEIPEENRKSVVEARISPAELEIDNILETLGDALAKRYGTDARVEVQDHSVGIYFGTEDDFSIDVVPAQPAENNMFWVPDSAHVSVAKRRILYKSEAKLEMNWIKSDPKGYILQATKLDDRTAGCFRKAAKFIKKWRVGCKDFNPLFPLKSFHLEIILTELLKKNPDWTIAEAIRSVFEILPSVIRVPQYPDRADGNRYIDEYVTNLGELRNIVEVESNRALELLTKISQETTQAAVIKGLEILLRMEKREPERSTEPSRTVPAVSKPYRP